MSLPRSFNRARMTTTTTGTGTITLGSAVAKHATFGEASVSNADVVSYFIEDGNDFEIGIGTYTASGTTLSRDTVILSKIAGVAGTTKLTLSGAAEVGLTYLREDILFAAAAFATDNRLLRSDGTGKGVQTTGITFDDSDNHSGLNLDIGCGILAYSSATLLTFTPKKGDAIKINGTVYKIPAAGIAGLANTSVFVNGTGASNLGASTLYYIYAFLNSGTVTADFRTDGNGHKSSTTAGNIGTEVRVSSGTTEDDTRTLIGLIETNASSQFADSAALRLVRSWFNDKGTAGLGASTTSGTANTTLTEVDTAARIRFVSWLGEVVDFTINGTMTTVTTTDSIAAAVGIDGTSTVSLEGAANILVTAGARSVVSSRYTGNGLTEGAHYATPLLRSIGGAATATFNSGNGARVTGVLNGVNR